MIDMIVKNDTGLSLFCYFSLICLLVYFHMYHVKFVYLFVRSFVCLIDCFILLLHYLLILLILWISPVDFSLHSCLPPFLPLLSYILLYSILLYFTMLSNSNVYCPSFSSPPSLNYPLATILHIPSPASSPHSSSLSPLPIFPIFPSIFLNFQDFLNLVTKTEVRKTRI